MRRYATGSVVTLNPPDWVSQPDAARELGTNLGMIGLLIVNGHLEPAETSLREMGVTRESLDAENAWRRSAPLARRVRRRLRDVLNWL